MSKAAHRSSRTSNTDFLSSRAHTMSFCTHIKAVSTLWLSLYADWYSSARPCLLRCALYWLHTADSRSLDMNARLLMGLKLLNIMGSRLYFFNNGAKIAHFKSLGKFPDVIEEFIILVIRESSSLLFSLSNQVGIGSNWLCLVSLETIHFSTAASERTLKRDNWSDCE